MCLVWENFAPFCTQSRCLNTTCLSLCGLENQQVHATKQLVGQPFVAPTLIPITKVIEPTINIIVSARSPSRCNATPYTNNLQSFGKKKIEN